MVHLHQAQRRAHQNTCYQSHLGLFSACSALPSLPLRSGSAAADGDDPPQRPGLLPAIHIPAPLKWRQSPRHRSLLPVVVIIMSTLEAITSLAMAGALHNMDIHHRRCQGRCHLQLLLLWLTRMLQRARLMIMTKNKPHGREQRHRWRNVSVARPTVTSLTRCQP